MKYTYYLLIYNFLMGVITVITSFISKNYTYDTLISYYYFINFPIFILYLLWSKQKKSFDTFATLTVKKKLEVIAWIIFISIMFEIGFRICNVIGMATITSSLESCLELGQGILGMLFLLIFRRKLNLSKQNKWLYALYGILFGIIIIRNGILQGSFIGILFIILSVIILLMYDLISQHLFQKYGLKADIILVIELLIVIVVGCPFLLKLDVSSLVGNTTLLILMIVNVLCSFIGNSLWAISVTKVAPHHAGITNVAQLITASLLGYLFIGEKVDLPTVILATIIFIITINLEHEPLE